SYVRLRQEGPRETPSLAWSRFSWHSAIWPALAAIRVRHAVTTTAFSPESCPEHLPVAFWACRPGSGPWMVQPRPMRYDPPIPVGPCQEHTMRALLAAILAFLAVPALAADLAVNLSGQSGGAFSTRLQSNDVQVARFVLQASGGDVTVDAITLHLSNFAMADDALTGVRLFYDADGNNVFDPSEE